MTEPKIYNYFITYHYGILDSYTTGIANMVVKTNCPQIKGENELESIKKLILTNHYDEYDKCSINAIILNIIPLPIEGK
jgi:hypothetical protein